MSTVAGPSKTKKSSLAASGKKTQKSKDKSSAVPIATADVEEPSTSDPKYEGTNTGWAYEPPKGAVIASHDIDAEEFDYDALKDDENLELWIVRIPDTVKPKNLDGMHLDTPSSSGTGRLGSFMKKSVDYDIWHLGDNAQEVIGGEELKNLTCLVPRKKKGGKLYAAPSSIQTRHIVISAQASLPTPPQSLDDAEASASGSGVVTYTNPPRPSYAPEALRHRFMPTGSLVRTSDSDFEEEELAAGENGQQMVVDEEAKESVVGEEVVDEVSDKKDKKKKSKKGRKDAEHAEPSGKEVRSKKRKVDEGSSPKKQKKAKMNAS